MKIFKTFFIALLVILGLGALGLGILSKGLFRKASDTVGGLAGKAKNEAVQFVDDQVDKTVDKAVDKAVEEALKNAGVSGDVAKDIVNSVSPEDREKLKNIASNHPELIPDLAEFVKNGDPTAFQKKIDETLHFDEAVTLKDLYNKYAEDFSDLLPIGN